MRYIWGRHKPVSQRMSRNDRTGLTPGSRRNKPASQTRSIVTERACDAGLLRQEPGITPLQSFPKCTSLYVFGLTTLICPIYRCIGRTATARGSRRVRGGEGGGYTAGGCAKATPVVGAGEGGGGAAARDAGSSTAGGGCGGRPTLEHLNTGTPAE